jgi:hypothetical protein
MPVTWRSPGSRSTMNGASGYSAVTPSARRAHVGKLHAGQMATPGQPAQASVDGLVTLISTVEYDAFGNVLAVASANNRCARFTYDTSFAQLQTQRASYPEGCAGTTGHGTPLIVTRVYDRVLERVTEVVDSGEPHNNGRVFWHALRQEVCRYCRVGSGGRCAAWPY